MYLTRLEEKMLNGELGEAVSIAMKAIVKVGEILGASRLVEITHSHISGISYLNIGDPGLEFIEYLSSKNARVRVFSTMNPSSIDEDKIHIFNISKEELAKQKKIVELLVKMGVKPTLTCTPYYIRKPKLGEHLAWGESSAVAYANIVFGARTNKEGGPLALFAAITGRTYYAGLHLEENRIPKVYIKVNTRIDNAVKAGLLGFYIGEVVRGKIPYIDATIVYDESTLKAFSAAYATSTTTPHALLKGVSPEEKIYDKEFIEERIIVDEKELIETLNKLVDQDTNESRKTLFIGCPHLGISEIHYIYDLASKGKIGIEGMIISTSRYVYEKAKNIIAKLESLGAIVVKDTCPIVSRLKIKDYLITNSVKAAFYMKRLHKVKVMLRDVN